MAQCFECGLKATQQHHVVPESLGGTKTVPLCDTCHPKAHGEKGYWKTSELIKQKLQALKAQGYRVGGNLPYGKMADSQKRLVDNPQERYWQYVAKYLHDNGINFAAIASLFNKHHVPLRRGRTWSPWKINQAVKRLRLELGEPHTPGVWAAGKRVRH